MNNKISFLLFFMIAGCSYVEYMGQWPPTEPARPVNLNVRIYLQPNLSYYKSDDSFEGVFRNNTSLVPYIVLPSGCGDHPLEKWNENKWERIWLTRKGAGCIQSVLFRTFRRGESRKLVFPKNRLIKEGIDVAGVYRFSFTISENKKTENLKKVYSREFIVK